MNLKITVVICTYNRAKFIGDALGALAKQTLDRKQFEVIVVNNNSTDETESITLAFIDQHPELDIKYVVESQQGLSFARNRGISEATYDIINYIDDDAIPYPNFLENILKHFTNFPETVGIGGVVIPNYEIEEPQWMSKYLEGLVTKVDLGKEIKKYDKKIFPVGCNMTYRKSALIECGGFNNALKWRADDKYIFFAIRKLTDQIYYVPDVILRHQIDAVRTSRSSFVNISWKTGNEEGLRIISLGKFSFLKKVIEYFIKFFGSIILAIPYFLKGQFSKADYLVTYRYQAIVGLFAVLGKRSKK